MHELEYLPSSFHTAAGLLNHMHQHGVSIAMLRIMIEEDLQKERPHLIYDFSWRTVNALAGSSTPSEAMRFRQNLHWGLDFILAVYLSLGPTYLCKANLVDEYMHIWV